MNGGYFLIATCLVCKRVFTCNPALVPSHPARNGQPVQDASAPKEPICEGCIRNINQHRKELGEPQWPIPDGAYDVAEGFSA